MQFKKYTLWTDKEDAILKAHFHDKPFSSHGGSRFTYLKRILDTHFPNNTRTIKSISRRTYRLGLRSITIENEPLYVVKCVTCERYYKKPKRYFFRDKKHVCPTCQKLNGGFKSIDHKRAYHRQYIKQWRCKNDYNKNHY